MNMPVALPRGGIAPLLGHNLVRLLYLDEAGIDRKSPVVCVAGVLIHGDKDWPEVDRRIVSLALKYVEQSRRDGFVFHATDIYHGSGYFDRRKPEWADPDSRSQVLSDLVDIIVDLKLPIVAGKYERKHFDWLPEKNRTNFLHQVAASDCLSHVDKWLAAHCPDELATVIHEDGAAAKAVIKRTVRVLRSQMAMDNSGIPDNMKLAFSFPLKRIIDTVHFAEKADARPLQLADICAFFFARALGGKDVPKVDLGRLVENITWVLDPSLKPPPSFADELKPA